VRPCIKWAEVESPFAPARVTLARGAPCLIAYLAPPGGATPLANERHSYVELYPSDWMAGTSYMPPMVEWLYLQVCLYNWDKREPVPKAQAALRFSRSPSWQEDLEVLIEAGKVVRTTGGGLFVERAIVQANKAYDLWTRKSRGGKGRTTKGEAQDSSNSLGKSDANSHGKSQASNQNQNQNQIHPQGDEPPNPPPAGGDLFFVVPADALKAFREHRVKLKAPMTPRAEELMIGKLEAIFNDHGHDPAAVIDQSIAHGWKGVFPLKQEDHHNGSTNRNGTGARGPSRGSDDGFSAAVDRRLEQG
jgi:hypothetical protein